jgi:UDP-N-acetylglucosamine 1-carboxyvinyltransferase
MDKIIIEGGYSLSGEVNISGSKNSALPILISTILTDERCIIKNVPELKDIETAVSLLAYMNKKVIRKKNVVEIISDTKKNIKYIAPYDLVKKMRASFLVAGPLLAKYGKAEVSLPGGCAIGVRPVDIHIEGFKKLGANVELRNGNVILSCKKLSGNNIILRYPSVGATENLIMASCLAKGKTIIKNSAREPEIVDLCNFLVSIGAKIVGAGTDSITIWGVDKLYGTEYTVIPDRIETGTYLIAGAITSGNIRIRNCIPKHLTSVITKLKRAGLKVICDTNSITLIGKKKIKPIDIVTEPYPGFPTDLQAQWMILMCIANGRSIIKESVFENRFMHVAELQRLGAKLHISDDTVIVEGNSKLIGAPVMVSDLRAGAALVLAGLVAKGKTIIHRVYHLDRGYENLEQKLRNLGAKIYRISD